MSGREEDDSLESLEDSDKSTSTEEELINQMNEIEQKYADW